MSTPDPFAVDEWQLYSAEPESLCVGKLNRAVRMLREKLHEQAHEYQARLAEAQRERDDARADAQLAREERGDERVLHAQAVLQRDDALRLYDEARAGYPDYPGLLAIERDINAKLRRDLDQKDHELAALKEELHASRIR